MREKINEIVIPATTGSRNRRAVVQASLGKT
jgi:hypothetical protein